MITKTCAKSEAKSLRHILSLSGGKDSAALAIYMRDRVSDMEYIFHDTGKELPDTYSYLDRLEAHLGKRVTRTTAGVTFDDLLRTKGGMLPSRGRRWCTELMKLRPFESYVGDDHCINYIGIRADEERVGYISHKPNISPVYPFREDGVNYAGVLKILEESGIGLPPFADWGRTRSGCFFCFFQQKIEWVRLRRQYPELFEQAKAYEKPNRINGNVFYWCDDEPLEELEKPERIAEIERNWEKAQERMRLKRRNLPLVSTIGGLEASEPEREGCMLCHL
jgi:3'-phosphoadenosine 5'-phosphosulfate sulfotransferase (PAPS reductase)/FAD synthetase